MHPVSWKTVCANFNRRGLNLPKANIRNNSLLMSLAWCFNIINKDSLWVTIIHHKYNQHNQIQLKIPNNKNSSLTWRSIRLGWSLCKQGLAFLLGNGQSTVLLKRQMVCHFASSKLSSWPSPCK